MTDHVLYRLYGADDRLLYVGITMDPPARFKAHGKAKTWWSLVVRIELEHYRNRRDLRAAEQIAIMFLDPDFNVQHKVDYAVVGAEAAKLCEDVLPEADYLRLLPFLIT